MLTLCGGFSEKEKRPERGTLRWIGRMLCRGGGGEGGFFFLKGHIFLGLEMAPIESPIKHLGKTGNKEGEKSNRQRPVHGDPWRGHEVQAGEFPKRKRQSRGEDAFRKGLQHMSSEKERTTQLRSWAALISMKGWEVPGTKKKIISRNGFGGTEHWGCSMKKTGKG